MHNFQFARLIGDLVDIMATGALGLGGDYGHSDLLKASLICLNLLMKTSYKCGLGGFEPAYALIPHVGHIR